MSSVTLRRRLGNGLFRIAFPVYRPLYTAFKARADRAERKLLTRYLREGSVVVDAGANIGIYSRFLSRCVGVTGTVHSFEPSPTNFAHLSHAVRGLTNIRAHHSAVGPHSGEQLLYLSDDLNVDHRVYPTVGEVRKTVSIRTIALDDYFPPGSPVDLIKSDIQGYELHALQGARRVLSENATIKLLLEFWPFGLRAANASPQELLQLLETHGFRVYRVLESSLQKHCYEEAMEGDPDAYYNLFALRE